MLRSLHLSVGHTIAASDGDIGKTSDFYFDDLTWNVRYIVVETGSWLSGRKVLVTPVALRRPRWQDGILPVSLTQEQVRCSPCIDAHRPLSRQHQVTLNRQHGWPDFWSEEFRSALRDQFGDREEDAHLRSFREVSSYELDGTDGRWGCIADFLVEDGIWRVEQLVAISHEWLRPKRAVVSTSYVADVALGERAVRLRLEKAAIAHRATKRAPQDRLTTSSWG